MRKPLTVQSGMFIAGGAAFVISGQRSSVCTQSVLKEVWILEHSSGRYAANTGLGDQTVVIRFPPSVKHWSQIQICQNDWISVEILSALAFAFLPQCKLWQYSFWVEFMCWSVWSLWTNPRWITIQALYEMSHHKDQSAVLRLHGWQASARKTSSAVSVQGKQFCQITSVMDVLAKPGDAATEVW